MTRYLPNEIACSIPGAKSVVNVQPCDQDIVTETVATEAIYEYPTTADTTKAAGKTYYVQDSNGDYVEFTGDAFIAGVDYFEKVVAIPASASTIITTVYERYTLGKWADIVQNKDGGQQTLVREHRNEIVRTVTMAIGTRQLVARSHAWDFWANRTKATYVPYGVRLGSDKYGEAPGMFR